MDKALKQIAFDKFQSISLITQARETKTQLENYGDAELLEKINITLEVAENWAKKTESAFWEAFKYPLQIFNLQKGDLPEINETVFAYDEDVKEWASVTFRSSDYPEPCFHRHSKFLLPMSISQMHRWTRLPVLEDE